MSSVKKTAAKVAKAAPKKTAVKKTAAKKTTAKKAPVKSTGNTPANTSFDGKNLTVKGTVAAGNVPLSKYHTQLVNLAASRGHSVEAEIEIAIHDHLERFGKL